MPESIIMELYRSEDKFPGAANVSDLPTKEFGAIRKA